MDYTKFLNNKNLSSNTITVYSKLSMQWLIYLNGREPNKSLVVSFINDYALTHKPRSVRLMYACIISFLKYEKRWKLIQDCSDIKLPSTQYNLKTTIRLDEYNKIKNKVKLQTWNDRRNWLLFSFLFYTGVRVSELTSIKKTDIYESNKLLIRGKGNKYRIIYLNEYLLSLIAQWNYNYISVSKANKLLTTKQINVIVKNVADKYFHKYITAHGLRRSYATNLLRSDVNLEVVRRILGHSNINTTSKYIQYTDEEIVEILKHVH